MKQIPLIILLTIILLMRLFFYYDSKVIYKEGDEFKKTYSITHEPKKNATSQYFFVDNIFVSLALYPQYVYGDKIEITGRIKKMILDKGELLSVDHPKVVKLESHDPVLSLSKFIRGRVEEGVLRSIPQREGGLLLGIILGVRDKIDRDFYEQLRIAGVLHVIAASGQNVSILAIILLNLLQKTVKRRYALLFTAAGILFYAVLAGFDPPIVRASIMALISYGALTFGRQSSGMLALLLTGWGMIIIDPGLPTEISFQLSFLATWGIMFLKPLLDKLRFFEKAYFLKEDITTTTAAQIATFPLILGAFGSYSLISLPVNILILWTIPPLMIIGLAGAFLSVIYPILGLPLVYLCYPFLAFFTFIIDLSSHFDYLLTVESLPQTLIFGYYMILFGIVIGVKRLGGKNS